MTNKIVLIAVALLTLFYSCELTEDNPKLSKEDTKKLNNSIIFDLYLNYELTSRNSNLATIIDFLPNTDEADYTSVVTTTNVGGEEQVCTVTFNSDSTVSQIIYEIGSVYYRYDFVYDNGLLETINIKDVPKISMVYDADNRLQSITRISGSNEYEFSFDYTDKENRTAISFTLIEGADRNTSSSSYGITWNSDYKLESIDFLEYSTNEIIYNSKGDISSFSFVTVNDDNAESTWEYTSYDDHQNWLDRKSGTTEFNRVIEY